MWNALSEPSDTSRRTTRIDFIPEEANIPHSHTQTHTQQRKKQQSIKVVKRRVALRGVCVRKRTDTSRQPHGLVWPPPSQLDTTTFFCSTTSARESPPCSRSLTPSPIPGKTTTQGALPRATPSLPPPSCAAVPMVPGQKASMTPVRCAAECLPFHSGALHSSARAAFRVVNAAMSVIDTPFDPCHAETPPPFVPIFPKTHTRASARYPGSFSQV